MRDRIEDLSTHARRGELGEAGLRQLGVALRASHEARLVHEAGCQFDEIDSILPGDDALARRVVNRVLASRKQKGGTHRRYFQAAMAALAWSAAAAAATPLLVASEVVRPLAPQESASGERMLSERVSLQEHSQRSVAPSKSVVLEAIPRTLESGSTESPESPGKKAKAPRSPREFGSSVQAFAEANRLRRVGRTREAIAEYLSLQKLFPSTNEALNSDLALGLLHLQIGAADAALVHFHRYLRRNANSPMIPEALFGEAQALDWLGRKALAQRSYASLIRRYPESAYASAARAKLQSHP